MSVLEDDSPVTRRSFKLSDVCDRGRSRAVGIRNMTSVVGGSGIEPWSDRAADLYEFIHNAEEAAQKAVCLHQVLRAVVPDAKTLLDVACGTGWHLESLRRWYTVEGLDASAAMLERARGRLSDVPLHEADMRSFELEKTFDVVICLSSSIAHMQSRPDLERAVAAMGRHTAAGGVLVIEPWDFPEDAHEERPWIHSVDAEDRAVALMETTTLRGSVWEQVSHYLVWHRGAPIEHLVERSTLGAFRRDDYVRALEAVGFSVRFDQSGLLGRGLFIATHRTSAQT